jgi:aubergine-like protein
LKKYHEFNHALPDKIIVYRDGVGDGQLEAVGGHEVEQFYQCFAGFQTDYR